MTGVELSVIKDNSLRLVCFVLWMERKNGQIGERSKLRGKGKGDRGTIETRVEWEGEAEE
jgi:hypothetical protein